MKYDYYRAASESVKSYIESGNTFEDGSIMKVLCAIQARNDREANERLAGNLFLMQAAMSGMWTWGIGVDCRWMIDPADVDEQICKMCIYWAISEQDEKKSFWGEKRRENVYEMLECFIRQKVLTDRNKIQLLYDDFTSILFEAINELPYGGNPIREFRHDSDKILFINDNWSELESANDIVTSALEEAQCWGASIDDLLLSDCNRLSMVIITYYLPYVVIRMRKNRYKIDEHTDECREMYSDEE